MKMNVKMNQEVVNGLVEGIKNGKITKSTGIRQLFEQGLTVKEISKTTGILYNMCYNIVSKHVLRNDLEVVKEKKVSFKTELVEFLKENPTMKKSEVVRHFIKQGRGEAYVYTNIKKMTDSKEISFPEVKKSTTTVPTKKTTKKVTKKTKTEK